MQVPGRQLAIDHFEAPAFDQVLQAKLGCIRGATEHRFAEKDLAESDSVEAAQQFIAVAAFHRMCESGAVHLDISFDHLRIDPGPLLAGALSGAGVNNGAEVTVLADLVSLLAHQFAQAFTAVKFSWIQHCTRCR